MENLITKLRRDEDGAQYIEYVIALVILAIVFLVVGREIGVKGRERGDESMAASKNATACGANLEAIGGDACK